MINQVMPEKERYKINIIPCNSGSLYKKQINKSKSADDMTILDNIEKQAPEPHNLSNSKEYPSNGSEAKDGVFPIGNHLEMIASRAKSVERKNKKIKSSFRLIKVTSISRLVQILSLLSVRVSSQTTTKFYRE